MLALPLAVMKRKQLLEKPQKKRSLLWNPERSRAELFQYGSQLNPSGSTEILFHAFISLWLCFATRWQRPFLIYDLGIKHSLYLGAYDHVWFFHDLKGGIRHSYVHDWHLLNSGNVTTVRGRRLMSATCTCANATQRSSRRNTDASRRLRFQKSPEGTVGFI